MALIQRALIGLASLAGLPATGPNLDAPDSIFMVADIGDLLANDRQALEELTANVTAIGNNVIIRPPVGEIWRMIAVGFQSDNLDADQAITVAPFIAGAVNLALGPPASAGNSEHLLAGVLFPQPLLVGPRDRVGAHVNAITVGAAGAVALTASLMFFRLEQ